MVPRRRQSRAAVCIELLTWRIYEVLEFELTTSITGGFWQELIGSRNAWVGTIFAPKKNSVLERGNI